MCEDSLNIEASDSQPLSWEDKMAQGEWSQPKPKDLGCLPKLNPQVQEFLSGEGMPYPGDEDDFD